MPQRSIRFPAEVIAAVQAEADRLGHPHTFSSVVVNAVAQTLNPVSEVVRAEHASRVNARAGIPASEAMAALKRASGVNVGPKPAAAAKPRPKGTKR